MQTDRFQTTQTRTREIDEGLRQHMNNIYAKMTAGVLVTAIVAMVVSSSPFLYKLFMVGPPQTIVMLAPLAIVWFGFRPDRMSSGKLMMVFFLLAVLYGISFSTIAVVMAASPEFGVTVAKAFFIATGMFAGMSVFGYTTKRDLSPMITFLVMGIWGVVIAGLLNYFIFHSPMLSMLRSMIAIPLFAGVTAWQTQNMKEMYSPSMPQEFANRMGWAAALTLYISFIAMFANILNLMSQR